MLPSPLFPSADFTQSERRVAQLLGHADAGEPLVAHLSRAAQSAEPTRRLLPTSALRGLNASQFSAGGALVATDTRPMVALMQRYSLVAEAGCTVVHGLTTSTTLPTAKTLPTATWVTEGQSVPESQAAFGQRALEPKYASAYVEVSRQLLLQGIAAEPVILRLVSEAIARAVDQAIIAGTGTSGQPQGVIGTAGVYSQSGSSLGAAGLRAMVKKIVEAGGREDRIRAVGGPAAWETLNARELVTGSGRFLWDSDGILGRPAVQTDCAPPATLLLADWSQCIVGLYDDTLALSYNPFANFRAGVVAFRIDTIVDVVVTVPAAFSYSSNIT